VDGSRVRREHSIVPGRIEGPGKRGKAQSADYVLEYRNTKLAVIEAKPFREELTLGVAQAKDYAAKLSVRFTYATNGRGIYAIDMHTGKEEEISRYPTPEELWAMTYAKTSAQTLSQPHAEPDSRPTATMEEWRDCFATVSYEDKGGSHPGRYYQETAIERVLQAVAANQRRILLTLATGTGKTFIAFQVAWKLFHSRWNLRRTPTRQPRILFLADRNVLADQAYNSFSAFPEDALKRITPDEIRKKGKVPKNGSIFFTIFQTFMSGTKEDGSPAPYFGDYPPDFFDLIIIDECHRGGANDESSWRDILDYFEPAVQLGLTATPKRTENADTYAYFGEPVFVYSLKEGINDGFLTPFRVKNIQTTLDEYVYTPDDTVVEGELEEGKRYEESDFNRNIEIRARERKRVEIFMSHIDPNEKTLVFCANQNHALLVRDLINQMKTVPDPNYCQRVTANDGALGDQHLRDFQDNEKTLPTILTTSQKLSTGVDARNVRNIVLMRPVNSMIEFKQIIGRGTRLYDGKYYFTIYDFVKAHHHFNDPEWDGELAPEHDETISEIRPETAKRPERSSEPREDYAPKQKLRIKLADGKERSIQHMISTSFWHPDGTPISAQQFMEELYGKLPTLFESEDQLREIWSVPGTRQLLLQRLSELGFGEEQLAEMQRIIGAENSDLFDVLSYVAYALPPSTRTQRAERARLAIKQSFSDRQQEFLDFVLRHYEEEGVAELAIEKLTPLLLLKYNNSINDALNALKSEPAQIRNIFIDFQQYLYRKVAG
jgi:type I restriction enzyme R subunit